MKVLVPLDGQQLLEVAVPAVQKLLRTVPDSELHLVQVLDPRKVRGSTESPVDTPSPAVAGSRTITMPVPRLVESHGEAMERSHVEAVDWLETLAGSQFPEAVTVTRSVWSRRPAQKIVELANEIDADVIVMATHARSGISHFLSGSVTEEVIRLSGRPVLVVGPKFAT